ncbi:MAG: hypothetical protein ACRCXX_11405, partial [Cetobacterium sp.]|uniref:hypothetical protein n=1 Tax=Cetobacterium sp. TaxID=2071632 RepID=UPI003F38BEB5
FINDLITQAGQSPLYSSASAKYTGGYIESLKAGSVKLPDMRSGQTITNDDAMSPGIGYRMILDTDVDQKVFDKLYFNRWRKPMPDTALSHARGIVIITRPDLNIVGANGQLNSGMTDTVIQSMASTHPDVLRMLSHDACPEYGAFMPVMTNACQGYDVPDVTLKTQEFGETFRGWKATYGRHTVDSRTLYSFSLSFEDNREGTIYNTIRAWVQYIESVNYGLINTKEKYIRERVVDYMSAVYFLVVGEDGETLLFWSKDTGIFPTSIPSSAYSMDKDGTRGPLKLSVQFTAMVHEEMNPAILSDLNDISKLQAAAAPNAQSDYKVNVESPVTSIGTTWVNRPLIVFDNGKFKLKWTEIKKN